MSTPTDPPVQDLADPLRAGEDIGAADCLALARDLLTQARVCLSEEERYLIEQRIQGRGWAELAAELGTPAGALRKRISRALDRLIARMGGVNGLSR
jgi:DNA-directed RNA polymerase specialized sigma24 family protein